MARIAALRRSLPFFGVTGLFAAFFAVLRRKAAKNTGAEITSRPVRRYVGIGYRYLPEEIIYGVSREEEPLYLRRRRELASELTRRASEGEGETR